MERLSTIDSASSHFDSEAVKLSSRMNRLAAAAAAPIQDEQATELILTD
jgi:hypothetical protein